MPTKKQRSLALLATARAANLPTVATHVGVGFFLAFATEEGGTLIVESDFLCKAIVVAALLMFLGSMLYVGGCFLGDAIDARFDAQHRPERPIPQGVLSAPVIAVTGSFMLLVACVLSCLLPLFMIVSFLGMPLVEVLPALRAVGVLPAFPWQYLVITCGLTATIVLYARYHKPLGVFAPALMALCRALLVIWAGAMVAAASSILDEFQLHSSVLVYAGCTFLYTLTLSLVARNESDPNAKLPGLALKLLFVLPPILLSGWIFGGRSADSPETAITLGISSLLFLAWCLYAFTRLKHSIPAFVSAALAGFCLMDACFAALIAWPVTLACLLFFLLALLLQRIAPAT